MTRIIIPTGYMGSGSSAITDLLTEYDSIADNAGSFEYIFMHCPDGVLDLEYKLLKRNNVIRSDEAIKVFRSLMWRLYKKKNWWVANYKHIMPTDFLNQVELYLNEITEFKFNGEWYFHQEPGKFQDLFMLLNRPLRAFTLRKMKPLRISNFDKVMEISFIDEKKFIDATNKFIYRIIDDLAESKDNLILDQFLLPHNIKDSLKFLNKDAKIIVVSRDPRDVFLSNKYVWAEKGGKVPFPDDVYQFCDYYKKLRCIEEDVVSNQVLRLNFEDLIYCYDDTIIKIESFLDLNEFNHSGKYKNFDPRKSVQNVGVFNKMADKMEEVSVIEKELSEFLYPIPKQVLSNSIKEVF